tara:strand:- start:2969 stop:3325 length:357 start_codon:yes stop_codon:yes gene_type:complete
LLQATLTTSLYLVLGADRYTSSKAVDYLFSVTIPLSILSFLLYGLLAYRSEGNHWKYAFSVYLLVFFISGVGVSLIVQRFYFFPPTSIVELPISFIVIALATLTGSRLRIKAVDKISC